MERPGCVVVRSEHGRHIRTVCAAAVSSRMKVCDDGLFFPPARREVDGGAAAGPWRTTWSPSAGYFS